jgi:hypothetical protein
MDKPPNRPSTSPYSVEEYLSVLVSEYDKFGDLERRLLRIFYDLPNHRARFFDLARYLGYVEHGPVNQIFYRLTRRFYDRLGGMAPESYNGKPYWYSFLAIGDVDRHGRTWTLRPELVEAITLSGLFANGED